jgi:hypothetical protein
MKFEMEIGWASDETITIESPNFEKIQIIQQFIEFQQAHGWEVEYEAVDCDEDEFEEDTEEEVIVAGLTSDEE